jgi:hypothetical protein
MNNKQHQILQFLYCGGDPRTPQKSILSCIVFTKRGVKSTEIQKRKINKYLNIMYKINLYYTLSKSISKNFYADFLKCLFIYFCKLKYVTSSLSSTDNKDVNALSGLIIFLFSFHCNSFCLI